MKWPAHLQPFRVSGRKAAFIKQFLIGRENMKENMQVQLASTPESQPQPEHFTLVKGAMPQAGDKQVLCETMYLSLDPYMRSQIAGRHMSGSVNPGDVMRGETVSKVIESNHPDFKVGDIVRCFGGWQNYSVHEGDTIFKVEKEIDNPSYALSALGMPGLTDYMGLLDIGQPKAGETVVVAAATGAVGSLVGQIAKLKGCIVVGIAGGDTKCQYAVETLGFDYCIDHNSEDLAQQLATVCSSGIDVYFENVGGKVFDAVMPLLNSSARVPLCGLISQYNLTELPSGPDRLSLLMRTLLTKRIKMQGFIVFDDYGHRYAEFNQQMVKWLMAGEIKHKEHRVEGLENTVSAFIGLLKGENFGKLVVRVGPDKLV